jgi:hypothetical protein
MRLLGSSVIFRRYFLDVFVNETMFEVEFKIVESKISFVDSPLSTCYDMLSMSLCSNYLLLLVMH